MFVIYANKQNLCKQTQVGLCTIYNSTVDSCE